MLCDPNSKMSKEEEGALASHFTTYQTLEEQQLVLPVMSIMRYLFTQHSISYRGL